MERLLYSEVYRCEHCRERVRKSRVDLRNAHYVKCPRCHSVDLSVLRRRDKIDAMRPGLVNFLSRLAGGKLYHCWFCRLQFYDLRQRFNAATADASQSAPHATEDDARDEKNVEVTSRAG